MAKCFLLTANPFPPGSPSYTWKACGESSSLASRNHPTWGAGVYWIVDGVDMFAGSIVQSATIDIVADDTPADYGSCANCTPIEASYDCINGACTPSTTYATPGLYQSLSECEINCGTGCGGKCISNEEWAQIEGLASQLKNKNCS